MAQQREIPILGQTRTTQRVTPAVIERLPDSHQGLLLSFQLSGMTDGDLRAHFGIGAGQWSRIRSRRAHFPTHLLGELPSVTGNLALAQYMAWRGGCVLSPITTRTQPANWLLEATA